MVLSRHIIGLVSPSANEGDGAPRQNRIFTYHSANLLTHKLVAAILAGSVQLIAELASLAITSYLFDIKNNGFLTRLDTPSISFHHHLR